MTVIPDIKFYSTCARRLVHWYKHNKRDLPWRRTADPYAILVSEFMLQQTQVNRVKAYFQRWMEHFPTIASLAAASEDDVLVQWQGLGYYSRARSLHKIAQTLIQEGRKELPSNPDYLAQLPGLGPYTVGAVCSIAFDLPVPAVDGNVRRVFSRLLDLTVDPAKKEGSSLIAETIEMILIHGQPRILTQSFIELGASVCTKGKYPHCSLCPLSEICVAFKNGTQHLRPLISQRSAIRHRNGAALLIGDKEHGWLVVQRPSGGLWSGFYEIPWLIGGPDEQFSSCLNRLCERDAISASCIDTGLTETLRFTRWKVELRLFKSSHCASTIQNGKFLTDSALVLLPMPAGMKRLVLRGLTL